MGTVVGFKINAFVAADVGDCVVVSTAPIVGKVSINVGDEVDDVAIGLEVGRIVVLVVLISIASCC